MRRITWILIALFSISLYSCGPQGKLTKQQKNDLDDTYTTLKKNLTDANVQMDGERVMVTYNDAVLFNFNSDELNEGALPTLDIMSNVLNKYPKTNILISGYTDSTGSESYNLDLSKRRADAASRYLQTKGVSADRLYTWGLGSKNPIATNSTDEGRAKNRRVQFVILYNYNADEG